jgi:hypothetical protein
LEDSAAYYAAARASQLVSTCTTVQDEPKHMRADLINNFPREQRGEVGRANALEARSNAEEPAEEHAFDLASYWLQHSTPLYVSIYTRRRETCRGATQDFSILFHYLAKHLKSYAMSQFSDFEIGGIAL